MKDRKKVSLILTSYNCQDNIACTLESIEKQDYPNIEIIIKDGESTDGTVEIIKQFSQRTKHSCKWKSAKDSGIYDAMNQGYLMSTGEIVAFFNDLFLLPNAVSLMVDAIESGDYDGAHADLIYADQGKVKRYWKMGQGKIKEGWMPGHPTLYLKREIYEKYGLYNDSYKCSADYEFMVRVFKNDNVKLAYVPKTIVQMYYGGTSTGGAGSYILSLKEAHRALKENNLSLAWWIDVRRTLKVLIQFVRANHHQSDSHAP